MHPEVFDTFFVNMVRIGETGGVLDQVLIKLAGMQKRSIALPKFAEIFRQANFAIPTPTRIFLAIGDFCRAHFTLLMVTAATLFFGGIFGALTRKRRSLAGEMCLRVPVLSEVVRSYLLVHISESLSMLLTAGVPLLELLSSVEQTLDMPSARRALESMRSSVERGSNMRLALEGGTIFPAMALKLIETGEKPGTLDKMFGGDCRVLR